MAGAAILKQGICSWTDAELIKSGKFFPSSATSSEDRLSFYSGKFPCVEVDMSTYVIPNQATCEKWAKSTVPGFVFHFKIFQFFTSQVIDVSVLPASIQQKLPAGIKAKGKLTWDETSAELRTELWTMYNDALRPVHKMGKLGVVLFQFQIPFEPCERTRNYLLECRARLAPEYVMAVEFRNLDWFSVENTPTTISFCDQHRLVLTCVDELLEARNRNAQPTFQPASSLLEERPAGEQARLAPRSEIVLEVTNPACVYIRVHRRSGDHRLLSEQELTAWADRIRRLIDSGRVTGWVYMTWNTHHENQAILNPLALATKIPALCYDWKAHITSQPGRLDSFFARKPAAAVASTPALSQATALSVASVALVAAVPAPALPPSAATPATKPPSPDIIEIIEYDDDPDMIGFYTSPKSTAATPSPKKHPLAEKTKAPASKKARAAKPVAPDAAAAKQQTTLASFFKKPAA